MLGLLIAQRHPSVEVTGIELDPGAARHASANASANGLAGRCRIVRGDVRDAPRFLPPEHFHRVVANPPFRRAGSGALPSGTDRARARHELSLGLEDLARAAAALVRCGGALDLIHLAERLPELCTTLSSRGLEPKLLRLVAPFRGSPPRLCLLSAVKGARPGLRLLPELILHEPPAGNAAKDKKRPTDQ